jgi:hypothetical protein
MIVVEIEFFKLFESLPNQFGIHLFFGKTEKIVLQQFGIQLGKF